jgi:hypothetical protein
MHLFPVTTMPTHPKWDRDQHGRKAILSKPWVSGQRLTPLSASSCKLQAYASLSGLVKIMASRFLREGLSMRLPPFPNSSFECIADDRVIESESIAPQGLQYMCRRFDQAILFCQNNNRQSAGKCDGKTARTSSRRIVIQHGNPIWAGLRI